MNLFVNGLMDDMDDVDLKEMFELYGEIKSARVVYDRQTGRSRGFGFVDMINDQEAQEAINLLNGVSLGRKKLSVQKAEEPQQQNRGAGGGGYNRSGGNSGNRFNNGPRDNDKFRRRY